MKNFLLFKKNKSRKYFLKEFHKYTKFQKKKNFIDTQTFQKIQKEEFHQYTTFFKKKNRKSKIFSILDFNK